MLDSAREAIRAQPWRALGMAMLAGACTALVRSPNPLLRSVADSTLASLLAAARKAMTTQLPS